MEGQQIDEQGNEILALERKSVQGYGSQDEYLYAMKEDLADWFNKLYGLDIREDNFFEVLETGVVLCDHANTVQDRILERQNEFGLSPGEKMMNLPEKGVQYKSNVRPGSFHSRDNIANFIAWCRGLGLNDVILFESDDLVERKNERSVVLCLLEVARRGARYGGMLAPVLIQLEEEIDAEIKAENAGEEPPSPPPRPRRMNDLMSLDEMVRELVNRCTCPDQFPLVRVSEGKYKIGDSQTLIFVRILRNHVMVRIGGGWDTLENYLNRHDPCQCNMKGHRIRSTPIGLAASKTKKFTVQMQNSGTPEIRAKQGTPDSSFEKDISTRSKRTSSVTPPQPMSTQGKEYNQTPVKQPPTNINQGRQLHVPAADSGFRQGRERSESPQKDMPQRQKSGIPGLQRNFPSSSTITTSGEEDTSPDQDSTRAPSPASETFKVPRPTSARRRSRGSTTPLGVSRESSRGPSPERESDYENGQSCIKARSRSVGPTEINRQLNKTSPAALSTWRSGQRHKSKPQEKLIISRDSAGKHRITGAANGYEIAAQGDTDDSKRSQRAQISPDRILPDKPKLMNRSQTMDIASVSGDKNSGLQEGSKKIKPTKPTRQRRASTSSPGFSTMSFDDYGEAPPEDADAYNNMEKEFAELLRMEREKSERYFRQRSRSADILDSEGLGEYGDYTQDPFQNGYSDTRERLPSNSSRESSVSRGGSRATSPKRSSTPADLRTNKTSLVTPQSTPGTPRRKSSPNVLGNKASLSTYKPVSGRSSPATSRESSAPASPKKSLAGSKENMLKKSPTRRPQSAKVVRSRSSLSTVKYHSDDELDCDYGTGVTRHASFQSQRARSRSRENMLDDLSKPLTRTSKSRSSSRENILDGRSGYKTPTRNQQRSQSVTPTTKSQHKSPAKDPYRELNGNANYNEIYYTDEDRMPKTTVLPSTYEKDKLEDLGTPKVEVTPKPRRDNPERPRTKIPMPVGMRGKDEDTYGHPLRRYDSGVDINNMSPTETSIQGDDACWQEEVLVVTPEALMMTNQPLTSLENDPDYF